MCSLSFLDQGARSNRQLLLQQISDAGADIPELAELLAKLGCEFESLDRRVTDLEQRRWPSGAFAAGATSPAALINFLPPANNINIGGNPFSINNLEQIAFISREANGNKGTTYFIGTRLSYFHFLRLLRGQGIWPPEQIVDATGQVRDGYAGIPFLQITGPPRSTVTVGSVASLYLTQRRASPGCPAS